MKKTVATTVATTVVVAVVTCIACPQACAVDWSGVELAWQNDPRPAADAPLPVELPPTRRTSGESSAAAISIQ